MITDPRGCGSEPWPVTFQRTTIHDSKAQLSKPKQREKGQRTATLFQQGGNIKLLDWAFKPPTGTRGQRESGWPIRLFTLMYLLFLREWKILPFFRPRVSSTGTILSGWICLLSSSLSLCCSLLYYCPTPRYNLAVLSFFLFCCHFLRFFLLVIFPFLTSYIIYLFCFLGLSSLSNFSFSLRGFKITVNGEEGMVQQNISSFTFMTNLTHNVTSFFYSRRLLGIHVGFAMLKVWDSSCPLLWCSG